MDFVDYLWSYNIDKFLREYMMRMKENYLFRRFWIIILNMDRINVWMNLWDVCNNLMFGFKDDKLSIYMVIDFVMIDL